LLGDDTEHRVGRDRHDRGRALPQERLADDVEDLVGAGTDDELVGPDAVSFRGRLDEPASSGGAGAVFRSNRTTWSIGTRYRAATSSSVASQV
jgi:hypothetical protein